MPAFPPPDPTTRVAGPAPADWRAPRNAREKVGPGANGATATGRPGPPTGPAADARREFDPHLTPDGIPRLVRRRDGAIVGGVAAGVAEHLRVPVLWVRIVFALLAVMGGAGVLGYALLWIFVRPASGRGVDGTTTTLPANPLEKRQAVGIAAVGIALMIAATALGFSKILGWVLGPLGLAAVGAAFIWREADEARRERWRRTAKGFVSPSRGSFWRLAGGIVLVVGGLCVFALGQLDFSAVRSALVAVLLTLVGVAVLTIPWFVRLVRDLGSERSARYAAREREEIAAHLHDSVLQTLVLIQKQSADSREVLRLARSQERELRNWLYGPTGYAAGGPASQGAPPSTFAAELAAAAGEVEDTYAVAVSPVVVGDAAMDPHLAALVAAAREAMVNAAKHAEVGDISVYAEVEKDTASVYVRDRGKGFDPATVGSDRRGLAGSIRGRMERHGGTATVRSALGNGTEVELTMPIRHDAANGSNGEPPNGATVGSSGNRPTGPGTDVRNAQGGMGNS